MKRDRNWRPSDGYEPACPKNMFLDLKPSENDREEYLNDKVREYLQSLGMLSESSKLDNLFYSPLEQAIQKSNFWTQNNDYDEADLHRYMGEDALQTDAAYELNQALMMFFKENNIPIVLVVESTDPSNNSKTVLHPKHSNYPNKVILGGFQSLTKSSRILIVLHMATFSDEFNPADVNSSSISRQVARIIRHEVIHADQLDKRSKNQKISRKKAKKAYQDQGLVPGVGEDTRTQYLSSHIEIDAYAHEIAEELYDLAGYEGALDILRNKKKVLDYPVSEQTKEYLYDYADEDFSFKLVKKVYTHLQNFKNSKVLESRIIKRILKEGLTSYDVEDVYSTAQLAHLGQKRRTGEDYFTHPRAVANIVRKYYPKDTRAYLVALLHDTIEDTEEVGNLSVKELTSMIGASIGDPAEAKDILDAVNSLTHAKNQPYTEYVQGLSSNPMALKVKLADMMHNLSSTPTERQKAKYEKAISSLSQQYSGNIPGISTQHVSDLLDLTETKNTLREFIREQLESEVVIIPNPPLPNQRAKEVLELKRMSRNPDISDALYEMLDDDITSLFHSILVGNGHEVKRRDVKKLKNSIKPIVKFHKIYFNAPRPSQLAARMGVDFEYDHLESAQTPSYPSGHAAQGYYMAEMLSRKYPKCAEELFGLADLIADSRLERGVHLPSDIEAGKLLAQKLASRSA